MTTDLYLPPKGEWERRGASSLGVDQSKLDEAVQFAKDNEINWPMDPSKGQVGDDATEWAAKLGPFKDRGGPAGVVIKDGYIVAEWGDVERVDLTFSATKSYVATIAGLAFDRGMIKSTSDAVMDYERGKSITMVNSGEPVDGFDTDQNRGITWEHLLQQTSEWEGTLYTKPDIVDWNRKGMRASGDFKRHTRQAPGGHSEYNDVRVNRTALALLAVWGESLPDVLAREVMNPIGSSGTWEWHGYGEHSTVNIDGLVIESVSGGAHWGGGLWVDTLDHARFGMLCLNRGRWGDKQIISEEWIDMMTAPSDQNHQYGYMWWLNTGHGFHKNASEDTFVAVGAGGNCVVIDPEKDLVVVTRWCEDVAGVVDLAAQAVGSN
ncbi:MAG: serine hydrolase [Chloroflexi bacterium]|nr:serine hydrolase [Chloroflexota bacterium]MDA1281214.1 serine hydrolase [Chloroflexota bacterium]